MSVEKRTIFLQDLMRACKIRCKKGLEGSILVDSNMSGLEPIPQDDWLYFGIQAFRRFAQEKPDIRSAAFIGSGNGIETIAALRVFRNLRDIYVTDLIPGILPQIKANILAQVSFAGRKKLHFSDGRDCEPLPEKVDLIYGNLPLIDVDAKGIEKPLATTTLTDGSQYERFSEGPNDPLKVYCLLSQLGFLLSAKAKLADSGRIITLIGGRIPYEIIDHCFKRAGLNYRQLLCGFKRQSDPQFLKEYEEKELTKRIKFSFYSYMRAMDLLESLGYRLPGVVEGIDQLRLRILLRDAEITAAQAYNHYCVGSEVGHIAFAFEAFK